MHRIGSNPRVYRAIQSKWFWMIMPVVAVALGSLVPPVDGWSVGHPLSLGGTLALGELVSVGLWFEVIRRLPDQPS